MGDGLEAWIEEAAELLPGQGPITVFIHHNTLHALESLTFEEAVAAVRTGGSTWASAPASVRFSPSSR